MFSMYGHLLLLGALATLVSAIPINDGSPGEHIQHVTIPPVSPTTASSSNIQRVPARRNVQAEVNSETKRPQKVVESSSEASTRHMEETTVPQTTPNDEMSTDFNDLTTLLPQTRQDSKMPVDDLVTANFWWGLGPVYPHLYQFKRVPHLVPIHSWNPYHDYYTYHQKYPTKYHF